MSVGVGTASVAVSLKVRSPYHPFSLPDNALALRTTFFSRKQGDLSLQPLVYKTAVIVHRDVQISGPYKSAAAGAEREQLLRWSSATIFGLASDRSESQTTDAEEKNSERH